ncbi:MAG: hypothetical protein JSW58_07500 [Candidatus Latescibacterota bacterium]|nr:MAG: hypothetical protein JSW58_07500 [Candidatus Latescibacterota bacterium]
MHRVHLKSPPESDPGNLIASRKVRKLYYRFLEAICGIHDEVQERTTRLESRVFFGDILLCRVVPYRDLFHVQVGGENPWEIRVRDAESCFDTLDHVLARFLDIYPSGERRQSPAT